VRKTGVVVEKDWSGEGQGREWTLHEKRVRAGF